MNPIIAFIKLIRLPNLLIIVLTQYAIRYAVMYPIISLAGFDLLMTDLDFFLLSLSTVMVAASGYIINDYFDVKIDRVNRPDNIIIGNHIKRRVAMGAHLVINFIAIIIAGYVAYQIGNWKLISIQLGAAIALWYYSVSFKKQVLIGNIVVAILAGLVPFVAGLYELTLQHIQIEDTVNQMMFYLEEGISYDEVEIAFEQVLSNSMKWVLGFSFFAFMSTMVREIIKDIEDYKGDKKFYSNTLPVVYGKSKAKIVAQFFAICMVLLMGYLQFLQLKATDLTSFMYFLFTVQIPLVFVIYQLQKAATKKEYHQLSIYMKLIMLTGILYTALFYFTSTINV